MTRKTKRDTRTVRHIQRQFHPTERQPTYCGAKDNWSFSDVKIAADSRRPDGYGHDETRVCHRCIAAVVRELKK